MKSEKSLIPVNRVDFFGFLREYESFEEFGKCYRRFVRVFIWNDRILAPF